MNNITLINGVVINTKMCFKIQSLASQIIIVFCSRTQEMYLLLNAYGGGSEPYVPDEN